MDLKDPHIPSPRLGPGGAQRIAQGGAALRPAPLHRPPASWRLLVVENDADDAEMLVRGLTRHGHTVDRAATGQAALQGYQQADLVLLDLELPDLDGLEVCREVRSACDVPVIAVTARGSELDRVLGLQAGADDYLVKPYGFRELMARIEAVMRRMRIQSSAGQVVSHGPLRIDSFSREVSVHGKPVDVTPKEFDLLHLLASHPGTVVSRHRIMRQVWGDSWSRRTIDTHVSSLRKKLGAGDWITTIRGVGLQFSHR